eukprot:GHVN01086921.1.p2 GENE.GHVN01086921.1~~GHVN01086921.1.p2  ORF type:complete len:115 (-),score=19.79 GHVN01086921.1:601-945(-)
MSGRSPLKNLQHKCLYVWQLACREMSEHSGSNLGGWKQKGDVSRVKVEAKLLCLLLNCFEDHLQLIRRVHTPSHCTPSLTSTSLVWLIPSTPVAAVERIILRGEILQRNLGVQY